MFLATTMIDSPAQRSRLRVLAFSAVSAAVLMATIAAYWPALAGPFLFDDFANLDKLGSLGGVSDLETFKAFVLGGISGPTGRPLSLLTFLIDGQNWPADPWPFKRTNLCIHLLNGALLFALSLQLFRVAGLNDSESRWFALLTAALWLLHPFLVSTTMYIVQRMAQLSTLFVFAGLNLYLYGRTMLDSRPSRAYLHMSVGIVFGTLLATLCKENGVLLPLLAGVLEWIIFGGSSSSRPSRMWKLSFLVVPSLLVVALIARYPASDGFFTPNAERGVSVFERLLTEARIMVDYLRHWFAPTLTTSGVFQDHVQPSRGLLTPTTTLLSIVFNLSLLAFAIVVRRRWRLISFGILFFYCAHLMESTVINLELYFEHRNYLASAFLLPPLLIAIRKAVSTSLLAAIATVLVGVLAGFTHYSARVWSSYDSIVAAAAEMAPTSARAQQQMAQLQFNAGEYAASRITIERAMDRLPNDANLLLFHAAIVCRIGWYTDEDLTRFSTVILGQPYSLASTAMYESVLAAATASDCGISTAYLEDLFRTMLKRPGESHPSNPGFNQLHYFLGISALHQGKIETTVDSFAKALDSRPDPSRAMRFSADLASSGYYAEARTFSDRALTLLDSSSGNLDAVTVRRSDIVEFQRTLDEELLRQDRN